MKQKSELEGKDCQKTTGLLDLCWFRCFSWQSLLQIWHPPHSPSSISTMLQQLFQDPRRRPRLWSLGFIRHIVVNRPIWKSKKLRNQKQPSADTSDTTVKRNKTNSIVLPQLSIYESSQSLTRKSRQNKICLKNSSFPALVHQALPQDFRWLSISAFGVW